MSIPNVFEDIILHIVLHEQQQLSIFYNMTVNTIPDPVTL